VHDSIDWDEPYTEDDDDDYYADDEPPDEGGVDYNEPASRCTCVDCIAASQYTGEVA
jgi:hypothetical protein